MKNVLAPALSHLKVFPFAVMETIFSYYIYFCISQIFWLVPVECCNY